MRAFSMTDIGKSRSINQDYVFCRENAVGKLSNLFIVADGMGGHRAGDKASKYAVQYFIESVENSKLDQIVAIMDEAIRTTNDRIICKAAESEDYTGMGTTLVVATIKGRTLYVANIGDSRLYLISDGVIRQITKDHSLVEEMVELGEITREEARFHEKKNVITRAIGVNKKAVADFFEIDLQSEDIILLCSDGLTNMVEDSKILEIVNNEKEVEKKALRLIELANNNGGTDNIAVVIVEQE